MIRQATHKDAQFLAWAILAASRSHLERGWFDIALNAPENACLEFLTRLTTTTKHSQWHFSRFLIAEHEALPVSTLAAFRARDAYPQSTAALMEVIGDQEIAAADAASIWERGAYMFKCTIRPDDDCWMIENLATLPNFQGRGYTSALMSHAFESGRKQGMTHASGSSFIGNVGAERAYLGAGFSAGRERRDPDFEAVAGAPGLRQYTRPL